MNDDLYQRLEAKGWSRADIEKAIKIINKAKGEKPKKIQLLDAIIYWFVLVIAIFGNFVISIALVPFLLEFRGIFLYTIIAILALVFGLLFDLLIRDIENLEQKHIIISGIFIPALAIINIFYITRFSNWVSTTLKLNNIQDPVIISIIYVVAFVAPYLIYRFANKKHFY